jgi:hypothetical protein
MRLILVRLLVLVLLACSTPPAAHPARRCDPTGAWSGTAEGVRARLVRAGERVELELENTRQQPLELRWSGNHLAFATFRLDDAAGAEIPEPEWQYPGNEHTGDQQLALPATSTTRVVVGDSIFARFGERRTVRIGAFWGREMPADGSPAFLRTRLALWKGSLEVPPVCLR